MLTIQIYILSKLMEGSSYPYSLKKGLSEPVPFDKIANITESKLYYHFESLTKQGLIAPTEIIKEENRPDKQVFSITEKGREALPKKIYQLIEKSSKMSEIMIGLMFVQYVEIEKVIAIIQVKKMSLEGKYEGLASIYEKVKVPDQLVNRMQVANDYFTDMLQREIDWFERVIESLHKDLQRENEKK